MADSNRQQTRQSRPSRPQTSEAHQLSQAELAALMLPLLANAWRLVNLNNLSATLPRFVQAVSLIMQRYGSAAALMADRYYDSTRGASGIPGKTPTVSVPPISPDAVNQLVVNVVSTALDNPSSPSAALDALDEEAEQLVLDHGRQQIIQMSDADPEARGWARVVEPGACSFCLMLAMRGPVYKSKTTANFRAHKPQPDGSGGLCRCHAEATFNHWEPQASVRAAMQGWKEVVTDQGRMGRDARAAFRQWVEGRDIHGVRRKGKSGSKRSPSTKPAPKQYAPATGISGMTTERLQHQLQVTEALKDSPWRTKQLARLRKELGKRGVSKPLAQVG